jgi:tyrosinase
MKLAIWALVALATLLSHQPVLGSAIAPETVDRQAADACRGLRATRREIMDLSAADWNRYAAALDTLRRTGVISTFVGFHSAFMLQAHGGCYFLPWHRQMLFEFERELNRVAPGVTIPYWDWTKIIPGGTTSSQAYTNDPVWNRLGGAAGNGPIPNPPFAGWTVGGTTVTRNFVQGRGNVGPGGGRFTFLSSQQVGMLSSSSDSFSNFADFLESNHQTPHVAVGGTMTVIPASPNDPVFWSHHAFVDKIWSDWQRSGNGNAFGGQHSSPNRACTLDGEEMNPPVHGRTVRQILTGISGCTSYAPSSRAGPTARFSASRSEASVRQAASASSSSSASSSAASSPDASTSSSPSPSGTSPSSPPSNLSSPDYALAFGSESEKKECRLKAAHMKATDPETYRAEVKQAVDVLTSMTSSCHRMKLPDYMVQSATDSFHVLLLKLGIDVVRDGKLVNQSTTADAHNSTAPAHNGASSIGYR